MANELIVPIHNSDRNAFKNCRRHWDYVSILRQAYRPVEMPRPLDFGISAHKAWEVWYDPEMWPGDREVVAALALAKFAETTKAIKDEYLKAIGEPSLDPERQADYDKHLDLGKGMLTNYFEWSLKHDQNLTPVAVEESFEYELFRYYDPIREVVVVVVARGRVDWMFEDEFGQLWLVDNKTTSQMRDNQEWLMFEEQLTSYAAFLRLMGKPIVGCIYNECYKGYPRPPKVLASPRLGRTLSVSTQQDTSYELMVQAIEEQGESVELYEEYLTWLKEEGRIWIRRQRVPRNEQELKSIVNNIILEAKDMLDPDLKIYPNPSPFRCQHCSTSVPCLAQDDGSDVQFILDNQFKKVTEHYGHI